MQKCSKAARLPEKDYHANNMHSTRTRKDQGMCNAKVPVDRNWGSRMPQPGG